MTKARTAGELFFSGTVNGISTGLSAQFDADSGDTIFLGGSRWTKVIYIDTSDPAASLRLEFRGFDSDATQWEKLGTVQHTFDSANGFGIEQHDWTDLKGWDDDASDPNDFKLRFTIHRLTP